MNINNIELRHLRYFLAVAEELNFSRAAVSLHISQPPLSQQIQEMEARLETQLFIRTKRKVELTQAGATLLPHAKKVLRDMEDGLWAAHATGRGQNNELKLGTIFSAPLVPAFGKLMRQFKKDQSAVRVVLKEGRYAEQVKLLEENKVDAIFTWQIKIPLNPKLITQVISIDPLNFYFSGDHHLATKKNLVFQDLANEPILLTSLQVKMPFYADLQNTARAKGISLRIVEESAHFTVITNLVAAHIGSGVLPDYVAQLATQPLVRKKIKGMPEKNMNITLALIYKADNKNTALRQFLDISKQKIK